MTSFNRIYLQRKGKILIESGFTKKPNVPFIASINRNLSAFGYRLDHSILEVMKTLSDDELINLYRELVDIVRELTGGHREYRPMYPNFPQQVMDADQAELYLVAIVHYASLGALLPEYTKEEREALEGWYNLKLIELGTKEDFTKIFYNLIQAKTSISETDKEDIKWFARNNTAKFSVAVNVLDIPLKENVALIGEIVINETGDYHAIDQHIKTATDVLRLAVALSDGDISLAEQTRFIKFKRRLRRFLLELLENCGNIEEDMKRYTKEWIRLGEILHPGEYSKKYPKAYEAFKKLRNDIHIETFGGKIDEAFKYGKIDDVVENLSERPGEFVRRLDYTLRSFTEHSDFILDALERVASQVSLPVLLQAYAHFRGRNYNSNVRSFFPKGNTAKVYSIENNLEEMDETVRKDVVDSLKEAMVSKLSAEPSLGKVYVDSRLSNYIVPQSQRSASKSLRTITRGSRVPFPEGSNILRSFIYWKQPKDERIDVDLSVVVLKDDWEQLFSVYYGNLEEWRHIIQHSGDITAAPNGATEFVDIDVAKVLNSGGRYVLVSINNYTDIKFADMPECFAGWMGRHDGQSGEIFDAKTVVDKYDLTAESKIAVPMVFDLLKREMLWLDLSLTNNYSYVNNVIGNSDSISMITQAIANSHKPTLLDLFMIHVTARGELVYDPKEADIVFSVDQGITPFDIDIIVGEYL